MQLEVEDWVRRNWMPTQYGAKFSRARLRLRSGGVFDFDAVSEDHSIMASISTSGASGNQGSGKILKSVLTSATDLRAARHDDNETFVTIVAGGLMTNLSGIVTQLKKERDRVEQQLTGLNAALAAFAGVYASSAVPNTERKISAKGRARIAAAQRARWAKVKGQKVISIAKGTKRGKRTMSVSARRKIAAAQRARWARVKRDNKAA
jgi:hypothetical protein